MKKKYLFFTLILLSVISMTTYAQKCPRCRGYGQINTSGKTAGYGLGYVIGECTVCGHAIFNNESHHHQTCPSCGGTGKQSSSSHQSASSNNNGSQSYPGEQWDGLTTDEWLYMKELIKESVRPNVSVVECSTCHGKGTTPCMTCNGRGVWNGRECPSCLGIYPNEYCRTCKGVGKVQIKSPKTEEEKRRIAAEIQRLNEVAISRLNGGDVHSVKRTETTAENTPKSASISNVWVDHNVIVNGRKGMRIHVQFSVKNMLYRTGKVAIYFYNDANSTPLKDYNGSYCATDGNVAYHENYTPSYADCEYSDFKLFMPTEELHCTSNGTYDLKFTISILDDQNKVLTKSSWTKFTLTN